MRRLIPFALALAILLTPLAVLADGKWGQVNPPPPILYCFFDWGSDFATTHPEYGPIGSMHMINWYQINPGPGRFDWSLPDAALAREAQLTVTLRDGRVIPKPVIIQVSSYLGQNAYQPCTGTYFWDGTPQWVYDQVDAENPGNPRPAFCGRKAGHAVAGCGASALIPMFDNATWRSAYLAMVAALGEHYRNNPQIVGVMITTGLDGETQIAKPAGNCDWPTLADQQVPGLGLAFRQFCIDSMRAYRQAFPTTPVWIQNSAGGPGLRKTTSDWASWLRVGIKSCGMWTDIQSHQATGSAWPGIWDMVEIYSGTLPIWVESAYGSPASPELCQWGWYAGLHYHPDGADVHREWLERTDPAMLAFVQDHLGRSLADTPDVWVVFRDREFEPISWGTGGQSGHQGDWEFWLKRVAGGVRVWRRDLPAACQGQVQSRQARRTDEANGGRYISLAVDKRVHWGHGTGYRVELELLNRGLDILMLEFTDITGQVFQVPVIKGPRLGPVDQFVPVVIEIPDMALLGAFPDGADFRIDSNGDGDETLHRIMVRPLDGLPPAPGPTATSPPQPTATATASPTPTITPTPTPATGEGLPRPAAAVLIGLAILLIVVLVVATLAQRRQS